MNKRDVALIGTYPPPMGGVSIHIERIINYLNSNNVNYILYDNSKNRKIETLKHKHINNMKLWLFGYLFKCNEKLIHLHEVNWFVVSIMCFIAWIRNSKVILTIHSFREEPCIFNYFRRFAFKFSIRFVDFFICVGENEKSKLLRYGCVESKIKVIPAYIHPLYKIEDAARIPGYVWSYIKSNDFMICANASMLCFYNNQDLYGLDMCIELYSRLISKYKHKKIGFIFCLPNIGDYKYYLKIKDMIKELNFENKFIIVNMEVPLCPIMKKCHLFIRPTNTDGDAISVREALYYKIPTIASDIVSRPEGTIHFKNRDNNELFNKTVDVIDNYKYYKDKLNSMEIRDNGEIILKLYKELLKNEDMQ